MTGFTFSPEDFPTANPIQEKNAGASDAFVTKFNPAGSGLVYSTYLGGNDNDGRDTAIAVDTSGRAYLSGETLSMNFPTANPFQPAHAPAPGYDIFVAKLNAAGTAFVYSTYLGGTGNDGGAGGHGIAADTSGNAYVTGFTSSGDFPRMNPFQEKYAGAGDAFVTKLNAAGSALVYSTFLGGGNADDGRAIAVDGAGNAYVTGRTASPLFPRASPIQDELGDIAGGDGFVTRLNPAGSALVYSTFLGGTARDDGLGIAVDASGNNAYVTGETFSTDFPTASPIQEDNAGDGTSDAFVAKISTPLSCTIHGTNQDDLLVGSSAADAICGRGGDDTIDGRAGDDDLRGGAGDDTIVGRAGADVIRGGAGNDDINARDGVVGNDTVYGGTGHDVCVIDGGDTTFGCETVTFLAGPQQAK